MSSNLLTPQMLQLATALGGIFDAQQERHANIAVQPAPLVRVALAAAATGYSVKMLLDRYYRWIPSASDGADRQLINQLQGGSGEAATHAA